MVEGSSKDNISYVLKNVAFNENTRIARIEIIQKRYYRTIQKYVTSNYEKTPIYSEWKTREKIINKTIKLTNSELEKLNCHEDELIRKFAEEIILRINNTELFPSWFLKSLIKKECSNALNALKIRRDTFLEAEQKKRLFIESQIRIKNNRISDLNHSIRMLEEEKNKKQRLIDKISSKPKSIFKTIVTFGIYNLLYSDKRKSVHEAKVSEIGKEIVKINGEIDLCKKIITDYSKEIQLINEVCTRFMKENYQKECDLIEKYDEEIALIKPLENVVKKDSGFIPLKSFGGLDYEKIFGCYIIHNKENDKYYVGQSKDIIRRIKQHFNGTTPKNSIFAEDYYMSSFYSREDLFEVKIIRCETKDELDRMEKQLILEYDSWNNGYNGTSGNT